MDSRQASQQPPYQWDFVTPGLPDSAFEDAPGFSPTPMELRVMLLAHLRPAPIPWCGMWAVAPVPLPWKSPG